jgi:hypothetical protein
LGIHTRGRVEWKSMYKANIEGTVVRGVESPKS